MYLAIKKKKKKILTLYFLIFKIQKGKEKIYNKLNKHNNFILCHFKNFIFG